MQNVVFVLPQHMASEAALGTRNGTLACRQNLQLEAAKVGLEADQVGCS